MRALWREWRALRAFRALPAHRRDLVFYSQGKADWPFLRPYIQALLKTSDIAPTFVSSATDDPGLTFCAGRMSGFVIGDTAVRTLWFMTLKAGVLVMTVPDLDVYHIKRSRRHHVHYVYVNHGCDSLHMVLRERALDHFDTVFCSGPHNIAELRRREELFSLPGKNLVEVGYPYLDDLTAEAERAAPPPSARGCKRVVVAPSWSAKGEGILENVGAVLVDALLSAGFEVTVRPHPRTRQLQPDVIRGLADRFGPHPRFALEADTTGMRALMAADVLVSDWSAIALEFAFSRLRPVLYIDVPRKVMNPNYERLGLEPLEVLLRTEVGAVLSPSEVSSAPNVIQQLCGDAERIARRCRALKSQWVYHPGGSAALGAAALVELARTAVKSAEG